MKPDNFLAWFPVIMRYGALIGVFYETVFEQFDRPTLLALFGAMLGLSEVAAAVREAKSNGKSKSQEPQPNED